MLPKATRHQMHIIHCVTIRSIEDRVRNKCISLLIQKYDINIEDIEDIIFKLFNVPTYYSFRLIGRKFCRAKLYKSLAVK